MIAVATDNLTGVLMDFFGKLRIFVPELPTGSSDNHKHSKFVASIHKRRVLRIVSHSDDTASCITQTLCIAPLLRIRDCIADIGEILMTVSADKLTERLAIEYESFVAVKLEIAYAYTCLTTVDSFFTVLYTRLYAIERRAVRTPQLRILDRKSVV